MTVRITDSYLSSILVGDLNRSLGTLLKHQQSAGSMRRVNSFADDPRAVSSIQRYNSLISKNDQYLNNVSRSRIIVNGTDSALQNISDVLADVRVIALRESSAVATSQSNSTSVIEVDNLINRLMDVLNTTIEGNYIFSGRETEVPPFARSGSTVLYQGDNQEIQGRTGPNSTMSVNIPGDVFMGTQSSSLGGTADLAPQLDLTTSLSDVNLGNGWSAGGIVLGDVIGNTYQIDLSSSATISDVINTINTATGGTITASINAAGSSLQFAGAGPLTVQESNGGTTAASLGIRSISGGNVLTGLDIRANSTDTTLLSDIPSLAGNLPLGTIDVDWLGTVYNVDVSGATTLGDLQTTFNATVPGMELQIADSSIMIIGGSPDAFEITNGDATNTASALGIGGSGSPSRLFGMLEDLKAALVAGDKTSIRSSMGELSTMENTIYQLMMKNGGRQTDLDWAEGILQQRNERLQGNLSLENDIDVAWVASELSRAETSYQASLLVTSKLYQSNLMQYLR